MIRDCLMCIVISAVFTGSMLLLAQSVKNTVPPPIVSEFVTADREQLLADKGQQEAMHAYVAAERKLQAAIRHRAEALATANRACSPMRFDPTTLECQDSK